VWGQSSGGPSWEGPQELKSKVAPWVFHRASLAGGRSGVASGGLVTGLVIWWHRGVAVVVRRGRCGRTIALWTPRSVACEFMPPLWAPFGCLLRWPGQQNESNIIFFLLVPPVTRSDAQRAPERPNGMDSWARPTRGGHQTASPPCGRPGTA